tara:strand:- start:611 stop:1195 length:585 start_codon:yes stop_codon:yes gene_type:complete
MSSEISQKIVRRLEEGNQVISTIFSSKEMVSIIEDCSERCISSLNSGGKIFFMGNGGSAADSQHLATELVSRYLKERAAIPAIALTTDTSAITAIGNDYSFEKIFSRQLQALATANDVVIGISTSGNSPNVILGVETARSLGCFTIGFTGCDGGKLSKSVDLAIVVPSSQVPCIQQAHIAIGHIICEIIEEAIQ